MSVSSANYPRRRQDSDCKDCQDKDTPTQKAINRERLKVCDELYGTAGELNRQQKKHEGENSLFKEKKCLFIYTEENFRRYRNLDIAVGTELLQTNESVKTNVGNLTKMNKDLNSLLKNIAKGTAAAKSKFTDLKRAADNLESCYNDSCNITQKKALTGKGDENCNDQRQPIDKCKDAEKILEELICVPRALAFDADSVFKASADVVGIQVFSNIDTLIPLQEALDKQAQAFHIEIAGIVKSRESDLKKLQEDLVLSVKDITKSAMDRNLTRSHFEGFYDATDFLCCPSCGCLKDASRYSVCDPRLKDCEKEICSICEEVKETFCCKDKN